MAYLGKCNYNYGINGKNYSGEVDCNRGDSITIPGTDIAVSCPSSRKDPIVNGYCDYSEDIDPPPKSILLGFGISLLVIIIIVVALILLLKKRKKN